MQCFSTIRLSFSLLLATALAACGSSSAPNSSTAPTGTNGSTVSTSTTGTAIGNTNTTTNANTTSTTSTTSTATVSVTGTLGSTAFTGKDAVYATQTISGVTLIYAVLSDAQNLCGLFSGTASQDANLVVIALLSNTGGAITPGDYTIEDSNSSTTGTTLAASATTAVGIADVSILGSDASTETDATSGDVNVTSYSTNNPLVFTLSAAATGSVTGGGLNGNVSAPACAALATALQDGSSTTTNTLLAKARHMVIASLPHAH